MPTRSDLRDNPPPNLRCTSIWDATTEESISRPWRTTAAAVSSQLVSMPRIIPRSFILCCIPFILNHREAPGHVFKPHHQSIFMIVNVISGPDPPAATKPRLR